MSNVVIGDILPYTQSPATSQGQTVFGTNWTANAASDVVVYYTQLNSSPNDATQILSYPADYSVSFIGSQQQVQVTLVTGAVNIGDIVTITRQTPADRENLYTNTNFTPSMLNNDFGILTLVDQQAQLVNQLIAPRYNYSSVIIDVVDTILPILGANQTWAKNGSNTAIVPITITPGGGINGTINIGSPYQIAYYAGAGNLLSFFASTTAVNYVGISNAPTTSQPIIEALGSDTNILLQLQGKGNLGVGIQGTSTNGNSITRRSSDLISSVISSGSAVSMVTATVKDLTSISLTAGDWDIYSNVTMENASSVLSEGLCWTSTTSATQPDASLFSGIVGANSHSFLAITSPFVRLSLASTTIVYVSAISVFAAGSTTMYGGIYARRAR